MAERQKRRERTPESLQTQHPQEEEDVIDLLELMYRLMGSWKLILCSALAFTMVAVVLTVFCITPKYEATSTIYVLSRRDSAINMSDLQIGTALTNDYIKVFSMWEVHEEVISNLNLPYTYKEMSEMLTVTNDNGTRMLDITFTSPSAQEAADVANEYAKVGSQYIMDTMAIDKPNIMSVALVPANPVSPNKTRNILIGFLAGVVLACGVVTVQMLLDDKYKTADDISKYTGMVTLAVVPVENEKTVKKVAKQAGKQSGKRSGR